MLDHMGVEAVALQLIPALRQGELVRREEGKQKALGAAVRTIAADRPRRQGRVHREFHGAAVALALKGHDGSQMMFISRSDGADDVSQMGCAHFYTYTQHLLLNTIF
jgi:hypothetical protein